MRRPPEGHLGFAVGAAGILVVVALLCFIPALPSLNEDVCGTSGPGLHLPEGSRWTTRASLWPLGTECTYTTPGGRTSRYVERPWPGLQWIIASLLIAAAAIFGTGLL